MRPKKGPTEAPKYRYTGYMGGDGKWVSGMEQCEEQGDHRVVPKAWPPPRTAAQTTDPHVALRCELCGAHVIVYEGHATGQLEGVDVILTEEQRKRTKQPA